MSGSSQSSMKFGPLPDGPLVSVLMPAYNVDRFLAKAIKSIVDQTYKHWELLLLDDGSTDGTASIIRSLDDARIRKFSNSENQGYLKACNRLFAEAQGDLVTFLDADDTCDPERLAICVDAMLADNSLGFVTTDHRKTDINGKELSQHSPEVDYGRYATDPEHCPTLCCATIFLRRELLQAVGGYHPFFNRIGGEDYYWLFHLARNAKGAHIRQMTYAYTMHPAQTHLRNSHPLKYFTEDIDQDLRKEWCTTGKDSLERPAVFREKWDRFIADHPHELAFRMAATEINRGEFGSALRHTFQIVRAAPKSPKAWRMFAEMTYIWSRRRLSGIRY
jgi:hypothetical protein